jgi:hypothetical protein
MAVVGMKSAVANVKYMRARVVWTNHLPPQFLDLMEMEKNNAPKLPKGSTSGPTITKIDTLWQIAGADVYLKIEIFEDSDANPNTVTTWKKDGTFYQLYSQSGLTAEGKRHLFISGSISPIPKVKSEADRFRESIQNTPLRLAYNTELADSFLQKKNDATFKGYNNIDGNRCMKIETHPAKGALYTWWIDVNHGFLIYRSEQVTKHDGTIVSKSESQASHLIKYGKTWLPQKIETKIDVNGEVKLLREKNPTALPPSLKDANVVVPPLVQEYTIQDVSIGDKKIPPVIWPLGTSLSFNDPNNAFTITAVTEKELAQLNLIRKTRSLPTLRQYPIGAQKPGMIGVALKNSEVKQLKKWRANDM